MKIINFKDNKALDELSAGEKPSQFLQSWEWGGFQESVGNKVWRFGVEADGGLVAAATLVKKSLVAGYNYLYCPRGPIMKSKVESGKLKDINEFLFNEIKKIAKQEKVIFLRIEPADNVQVANYSMHKTINVQPNKTRLLDLAKTEEELLGQMHQKTRYNIRLAEKKGVTIREADAADFANFWKLMETTRERDGFRQHDREYYQSMISFDSKFIKLVLAVYQGKVLAGNIIAHYGNTDTYVHGASANENREVMAPYLLQWQTIKRAMTSGYKYYDFYGIDENKWPGVTRFKKGFGGFELEYPGTFDVVFNKALYDLYKFLRKVRRVV